VDVAEGAGHKAKQLLLQCINGVSSNPVEGRTKICQIKELILTLFAYFSDIYIYVVVSFFGFWNSSNSVWFIFQTYIYMWLSVSLVSGTALTVFGLFFRHIYVVVSFFGF
jgi:hypothetical protein